MKEIAARTIWQVLGGVLGQIAAAGILKDVYTSKIQCLIKAGIDKINFIVIDDGDKKTESDIWVHKTEVRKVRAKKDYIDIDCDNLKITIKLLGEAENYVQNKDDRKNFMKFIKAVYNKTLFD